MGGSRHAKATASKGPLGRQRGRRRLPHQSVWTTGKASGLECTHVLQTRPGKKEGEIERERRREKGREREREIPRERERDREER